MSEESRHHTSKRNHYTIVLVPNEDAANAKNYRLAPWQVGTFFLTAAVLLVVSVLAVLIYTPVGAYLPIANPELENKYSRELIALNQRMLNVMEQLVEMRAYNVKLRQALGEKVTLTDSGVVTLADLGRDRRADRSQPTADPQRRTVMLPGEQPSRTAGAVVPVRSAAEQETVSFPAIMPASGYITRGFDPDQRHFGLDVAGKTGTPILAAADGFVVFSGWTPEDGYLVIMSHTRGFMTLYKHNQTLLRSTNAYVRRGEPVATLGNSGQTSSGPHLHFEIWKDGAPVDPALYVLNLNL